MFNKILFIGLGGAGQRHLRIIKNILPNAQLTAYRQLYKTPYLNSNFTVNQDLSISEEYGIKIYDTLDDAYMNKPNLVVISTPTSMHYKHIKKASEERASIIVEKPGSVNKLEALELSRILKKNGTKFLISFQRRFHPLIKKFKSIIEEINPININNININVNSYVPSWHPYENYKELYACKSSLGGGVLLTESHEIDLVIWLFGSPKKIKSTLFSKKEHHLDVEDAAKIILEYDHFNISLNLNFMEKVTERSIKIDSETQKIFLDLEAQKLVIEDKNGSINEDIISITNDQLFEKQFNYFMSSDNDERYIDSLIKNLACIDLCKKSNHHN